MNQKTTSIKERILLLSELQNISKTKFFSELGQSYSNFTGRNKKTAVPSDFLSRLLTKYPKCNSYWLLTGKGKIDNPNTPTNTIEFETLQEEIVRLKQLLEQKTEEIKNLKA